MRVLVRRVLLGTSLLALSSCAALFPFDYYVLRQGPIPIGQQWTEIRCPDVIETSRRDKELWLSLPYPLDVPDYRDAVAVSWKDGKRVAIFAEVVDSEGKVYPLPTWMTRAGFPDRRGNYMRLSSPKLPSTFQLTAVRLRSSSPITLSEVLWSTSSSPGPPVVYADGGRGAAALTKEELANVDYESCPNTYVKKAGMEFRSGLLAQYAGEHLIWPPRKFWYKTPPSEGGKLLAGYVVPVRVNQTGTLGQNVPLGVQTWALLFKNEEIVKKLDPRILEGLIIPTAIGPDPKDERDWKIGQSGLLGNIAFQDWVLLGETVENWTERVTLETHYSPRLTVEEYLRQKTLSVRNRCANVTERIILKEPTGIVIERSLLECNPVRDEYHIAKLVVGPQSLTNVVYARTTPFDSATKSKWLEIVGRTRVMGDC